jgi:exodeoxyribonuclease V alpha subunit
MLDLALATRLLEAVPPSARVVLLGDKDQLAAVESGAVFAELSSLPDVSVWLTRNYRFAAESGIGRLAADINAGRADEAAAWLRGEHADVAWHEAADAMPHVEAGFAAYFGAVRRDPHDVNAIHEAFGRFRVLCAVRAGRQGVDEINASATGLAARVLAGLPGAFEAPARSPWYTGRPVMVTVNDYALKLFNGDIGIALPSAQGEAMVWFPDGASGWRAIAPARMPPHETAFAMTVHKSQGSEFDDVLVVLPGHRSAVLARELLYTAVTRARKRVTLLATEEALRAAIEQKVERASGLLARLRP